MSTAEVSVAEMFAVARVLLPEMLSAESTQPEAASSLPARHGNTR